MFLGQQWVIVRPLSGRHSAQDSLVNLKIMQTLLTNEELAMKSKGICDVAVRVSNPV